MGFKELDKFWQVGEGQERCDKEGELLGEKQMDKKGLVSQPQKSEQSVLLSFTFGTRSPSADWTGTHFIVQGILKLKLILSKCWDDKAWVTILDWALSLRMFLPQACIKDFIDITMFPSLRTGHPDHEAQIIENTCYGRRLNSIAYFVLEASGVQGFLQERRWRF